MLIYHLNLSSINEHYFLLSSFKAGALEQTWEIINIFYAGKFSEMLVAPAECRWVYNSYCIYIYCHYMSCPCMVSAPIMQKYLLRKWYRKILGKQHEACWWNQNKSSAVIKLLLYYHRRKISRFVKLENLPMTFKILHFWYKKNPRNVF